MKFPCFILVIKSLKEYEVLMTNMIHLLKFQILKKAAIFYFFFYPSSYQPTTNIHFLSLWLLCCNVREETIGF